MTGTNGLTGPTYQPSCSETDERFDSACVTSACIICGSVQDHLLRKLGWAYARCLRCGLLSSQPIPSALQIEEHYRAKFRAGNYDTAQRYASQYRRIHEQIARWLAPTAGERILDIGCFTGELLAILSARGADVYGVELQSEAVEVAKQRLPGRIFKADVEGSAFPAGPYDTVTMMAVIEHVTDPAKFVRRAHSLLIPGGRLLLETPDASSLLARLMRSHWPPLAPIEHIHLFSRKAMRKLLEDCGFVDVKFRAHIKTLPVGYVYEMLSNFGPEWRRVLRPVHALLRNAVLPFYVGEMLVSAVRA